MKTKNFAKKVFSAITVCSEIDEKIDKNALVKDFGDTIKEFRTLDGERFLVSCTKLPSKTV